MASDLNAKKKELETLYAQLLSFQMDTIAGDAPSRTARLDVYVITKFVAKNIFGSNSGCDFFSRDTKKKLIETYVNCTKIDTALNHLTTRARTSNNSICMFKIKIDSSYN